MPFPRIALLTWCSPDSRYAGGAAVRRLLECLPADRIRWCGFHPGTAPAGLPPYRAFPARPVHWRLRGTWLEHAAVDALQARALAARMWDWLAPFDPQVLWVFPEVWTVSVARALHARTRLPMHATVHDAPATAAFGAIPRAYASVYRRHWRGLVQCARSVDAVSEELLCVLARDGDLAPGAARLVVPPCFDTTRLPPTRPVGDPASTDRVIGLCGSLRQSPAQWAAFLRHLGSLPYRVTIRSFTPAAELPSATLPPNVTITPLPYAATEYDVVAALAETDATYLGLWTEPERRLFGATSVSSKLTAYAGAGRPVLVDAAADSVAWRLVSAHGAGVRLGDAPAAEADAALRRALARDAACAAMGAGARRLCLEQFARVAVVARLRAQLETTAAPGAVA